MAQSDKIGAVANGSGLQVRSGFNEVGLAISSKNSGSVAPLNPVEFMTWDDPTGGIERQRNSANSGWLIVRNYAATAAPTVNDDSGDGYTIGSQWYDTSGNAIWVCENPAVGAAAWARVGVAITSTKLDDFAAPDDNTDLNATTGAHGLLPKLSGSATEYLNGEGNFTTPAGGAGGGLTVLAPHATTAALTLTTNSVQAATAVPSSTTLPAIGTSDHQIEFTNRSGSTINVARATSPGTETIRVDGATGQTTVAVPDNSMALFHADGGLPVTEWQVQIVNARGETNTTASVGGGAFSILGSTPKTGATLNFVSINDTASVTWNLTANVLTATATGGTGDSRTNVPAIDTTAGARNMNIANDLGGGGRNECFIRMSDAVGYYNVVKNIAAVGQRFMVQWTNASPAPTNAFTATGGGVTFVPASPPTVDTQYQTLCLLCVDATTDNNVFQILPASL